MNIASTKEELERAYSLLHDCYVGKDLMAADASGLRCNFFSFLPVTTTVVAKVGDTVVGTVGLIKDSPAGLPSDKDFKAENDKLRLEGHLLVEVSSLAIDKNYRKKSHIVSLFLMKYLTHYSTHFMGCTTVTCVVHPRARDFYAAFWGFSSSSRIVKYKFVNDALGAHMFGNITEESLKPLAAKFPSQVDRNPIAFASRKDEFLLYPPRKVENHLDPIFTPELLKYFMVERTQVLDKLTPTEILMIYSAYRPFFENLESLGIFKNLKDATQRERHFRFPTKIQAHLSDGSGNPIEGYIMDLSHAGAFFATDQKLNLDSGYRIEFELDAYKFSFPVLVRWRNRRTRNHQVVGFGIAFMQTQLNIARVLKQTHLTAISKVAK